MKKGRLKKFQTAFASVSTIKSRCLALSIFRCRIPICSKQKDRLWQWPPTHRYLRPARLPRGRRAPARAPGSGGGLLAADDLVPPGAAPVGDEDGRKFIDLLQEENALSPYDQLANQKWSEEVRRLLTTLTPIESRMIRWRFGLDDEDELTLKEIGDKYNLSRERIRQLQEQALGKIRKQMRDF